MANPHSTRRQPHPNPKPAARLSGCAVRAKRAFPPRAVSLARFVFAVGIVLLSAVPARLLAQAAPPSALDLINTMLSREKEANDHRERFQFVSDEKSERTGFHLWTERVVETPEGKVRMLLAEDGKPLPPDRAAAERARLNDIVQHPDAFLQKESATKNDEEHARQMLAMLPRGFILSTPRADHGAWRIDFKPDPNYSGSGVEDRVLHGMSGFLSIDAKAIRLVHIEGRLNEDVGIGFGLLANVHAGSNFEMDKAPEQGYWRGVHTVSDIRGKAVFFKTIAKSTQWTRRDFQRVADNLSLKDAVALAEKAGPQG